MRALKISTWEGDMECYPGNWVLRGIAHEIYTCENSVFINTYDEVLE